MSSIDYIKAINILSKTLMLDKKVDVKSAPDSTGKFDVALTGIDGVEKMFHIHIAGYKMEILFKKSYLQDKKEKKWLSKIEYDLEQAFYTNIKIDLNTEQTNYRMKIAFG